MNVLMSVVRWISDLVYMIRHGEDDLDDLFPDRHHASGAEAVLNASVVNAALNGGHMGL
jgi:hypothetical protein